MTFEKYMTIACYIFACIEMAMGYWFSKDQADSTNHLVRAVLLITVAK